jgi:hypothetical protein
MRPTRNTLHRSELIEAIRPARPAGTATGTRWFPGPYRIGGHVPVAVPAEARQRDPALDEPAPAAVKAIDDAVYGLMLVLEG